MISVAAAADQLERIQGMVGFPRGRESEKYALEMRLAIQSARSEAIARQVVSDILREFKRCPAVADIYEAINEENNRGPSREQPKCELCHGAGAVTVWVLATYNGRSMKIKSEEILRNFTHEKAQEFGKELRWDDGPITPDNPFRGDNQQIVTGAKPCMCKRAA